MCIVQATRPSRTAKTAAAAKIAGLDKEEAAVKDAAGTEVEAAAGKKEAAGSRKEAAGTKKGKGNAEPHGPWAVDEVQEVSRCHMRALKSNIRHSIPCCICAK